MKAITNKLFLKWATFLFFAILIFLFLHECGHGFGSQLDGVHVSTGFNRVGDVGKKPSDPDFRSNSVIQFPFGSGDLLGPFTNWMFAILLTIWLLNRKTPDQITLVIGAGAVSNALIRFIPMLGFFVFALMGNIQLEDEVGWGLGAVQGINFPISYAELQSLITTKPALFLSEPRIYFWPLLSLTISFIGGVFSYRQLYRLFAKQMPKRMERWIFGLMPIIIWPIILIIINKLDNLIRINW